MKILHIADLHLGAKNSKLPKEKQDLLKDEMLDGCNRLFGKIGQDYDVALVCGDLFHNKSVPAKIVNNFFQSIRKFGNPVLYVSGNHDEKVILPDDVPENFVILNTENSVFSLGDFNFYCAENLQSLDQTKNNVLLLHGNVENTRDNDYVDINNFLKYGFDYIALGHIHQVKKYKKGEYVFAYPGSLFSNGFDECGDKGYIEVEIEDKQLKKCEFKPLNQRRYMICEYDITQDNSNQEILAGVEEKFNQDGIRESDIVRLVLNGYYEESSDKSVAFLLNNLDSHFYIEIVDNSKLKIDIDKMKSETLSLKNEFISLVENSELDENVKEKIISLGIEALKGEDLSI